MNIDEYLALIAEDPNQIPGFPIGIMAIVVVAGVMWVVFHEKRRVMKIS